MKIGVVGHGRMGKKIQEVIESYEHEVVFPKVSLKKRLLYLFRVISHSLLIFLTQIIWKKC